MKHQFMPMFWGDFLANTLNLTAAEVGAYVLLIGHAWEHGGRIPYEHARQIARVDHRHWGRTVRKKLEPFFEIETDPRDGTRCLVSRRVLIELALADKLLNKRKASGMAGAMKRWGNPMASAMNVSWQTQCDTNGKLPKKERKKEREEEAKKEEIASSFADAARASEEPPPEKQEEHPTPASLLATALPTGALARSPALEQVAWKTPSEATRGFLEKLYAAKRAKKAPGKSNGSAA